MIDASTNQKFTLKALLLNLMGDLLGLCDLGGMDNIFQVEKEHKILYINKMVLN